MSTDTMPTKKAHHGNNIKRLREMLGVKQEAIAIALDMTQQNLSKLEQREEIEDDTLEKIAQVLQVPVNAIKNLTDDATYSFINTFNDGSSNTGYINSSLSGHYQCSFNPLDKVVELYERMLKEKSELLEKMLKEK